MIPNQNLGQGPDVVLGLIELGGVAGGAQVYFDNLFCSIPLLDEMSKRGIGGTGTMRQNRLGPVPLPKKKEVEKNFVRGGSMSMFSGDKNVVVWKDNKPVYMANIQTIQW